MLESIKSTQKILKDIGYKTWMYIKTDIRLTHEDGMDINYHDIRLMYKGHHILAKVYDGKVIHNFDGYQPDCWVYIEDEDYHKDVEKLHLKVDHFSVDLDLDSIIIFNKIKNIYNKTIYYNIDSKLSEEDKYQLIKYSVEAKKVATRFNFTDEMLNCIYGVSEWKKSEARRQGMFMYNEACTILFGICEGVEKREEGYYKILYTPLVDGKLEKESEVLLVNNFGGLLFSSRRLKGLEL